MPDIDDYGPSHHRAEDDPDLEDLCDDNPHDDESGTIRIPLDTV